MTIWQYESRLSFLVGKELKSKMGHTIQTLKIVEMSWCDIASPIIGNYGISPARTFQPQGWRFAAKLSDPKDNDDFSRT